MLTANLGTYWRLIEHFAVLVNHRLLQTQTDLYLRYRVYHFTLNDDEIVVYISFNIIQVILRQWRDYNEKLSAMNWHTVKTWTPPLMGFKPQDLNVIQSAWTMGPPRCFLYPIFGNILLPYHTSPKTWTTPCYTSWCVWKMLDEWHCRPRSDATFCGIWSGSTLPVSGILIRPNLTVPIFRINMVSRFIRSGKIIQLLLQQLEDSDTHLHKA